MNGDIEDRVFKDDLLEQIQGRLTGHRKQLSWKELLPEIKRLGYIYDRDGRATSLNGKKSCKGVILGLKWTPDSLRYTQFITNEMDETF